MLRKQYRYAAKEEKDRLPIGGKNAPKGSREMKGAQWMDIRSDRQKFELCGVGKGPPHISTDGETVHPSDADVNAIVTL